MQISTRPIQSKAVGMIGDAFSGIGEYQLVITPIGPHSPQVPIPELIAAPFIFILKMHVAIGPVIAEVMIGGSHVYGFLIILPI